MSNNILRNIKLSFEWEDYIEENFAFKRVSNGEYRINCFMCGDSKYKLYINPDKRFFNCFKCDFRIGQYDLFDFVSITEGITRSQAILQLGRQYVPTTPIDLRLAYAEKMEAKNQASLASQEVKYMKAMPLACKRLVEPAEGPGWAYLLARGFTVKEVLDLGAYYVPDGDYPVLGSDGKRKGSLGNRVVFPVYGGNHELVSWQGRVADLAYTESDKYLAAPESDLAKTLFPYVPPYENHAIMVEGIVDAVAVRRCGAPVSAYATFGKKISREQISLLKLWGVTDITLFFDKKDAKKEMIRDSEILKMYFDKVHVLDMTGWPKNTDSGDCLNLPNGTELIADVISKKIDVYSLDFQRWQLTF